MLPAVRSRRAVLRTGRLSVAVAVAVASVAASLALPATPAAAVPPPTPTGLPAAIEAYQPYVGQQVCDPVAKPGVRAFSTMVLNTYRDTSSLGIVRDCGAGGQSEHKEGRAWDWGVSAYNATQAAEARELLTWLMATDSAGNKHAMLRRLGIMYVIWNRQIFKAYAPDSGWQPYSGASPHTDHVHFSFSWAGAKQVTSYWDKTVAAVDYGPTAPPPVVPVASPANVKVLATYGATTLRQGSSGEAVKTIQRPLRLTADGAYGPNTAKAVTDFQRSQGLPADGVFGPDDWIKLFPRPVNPFGRVESASPALGDVVVRGWALDAESSASLLVHFYVDGVLTKSATADVTRNDVSASYPGLGTAHGFAVPLTLTEGPHNVCVLGVNAPGTAGVSTRVGCLAVTVEHSPRGALESFTQGPGGVRATGWAIDPDSAAAIGVRLLLDGRVLREVTADATRNDIAAAYPLYGAGHGFNVDLSSVPEGTRQLCVDALNATGTPGALVRLPSCRSLAVRHTPVGVLDALSSLPGRTVVSGWALDPDSAARVAVRILVDGRVITTATAQDTRAGLPAAYAAYDDRRGFVRQLTLAAGRHTVCAEAVNVSPTPGGTLALGCREVTVTNSPVGALEAAAPGVGGVDLRGWALDPDVITPVVVELLVDGRRVTTVTADDTRADISARYPGQGAAHGWAARLTGLTAGTRKVCAYGLNASGTPGARSALGCRDVLVRHDPLGTMDVLTSGPGGVALRGWALDPDTTAALAVHIYVDGVFARTLRADLQRPDVAAAHPGQGPLHGYSVVGLQLAAGSRKVCTYGVNATGTQGRTALLGCRTVVVRHDPLGALDPLTNGTAGLGIRGWVLDPDTKSPVDVQVWVDGRYVRSLTANLSRPDVAAMFPAYGAVRGFQLTAPRLARGAHHVCIYGLNVAGTPGAHRTVSCRTLTVA